MNITDNLLSINPMTRPGKKLESVKKIIVHYVGNPTSTAVANRNYFERLSTQTERYASSHYIIGLEGEIIRCVPEDEVAWHAANLSMNYNSIGIENCHPDKSGKFNDKTLNSLYEMLTDICMRYNLNPTDDIIRHYDVSKKLCPKYYVENESEWLDIKKNVQDRVDLLRNPVQESKVENIVYKNYVVLPEIGLNLRQYPDISSKKLSSYKYNAVIEIGEISNGWGKTKDGGWVSMQYVKEAAINTTKYAVIPRIGLNCREKPDIKSKIVTSYKYGSILKISDIVNEWGKTKDGYVNMKYVKLM
ncbi:MAG: amidase [Clostridia bacterium]|nr:amidase [Clostridia bacterium]